MNLPKPLEWKPESIEELRNRFPIALQGEMDPGELIKGKGVPLPFNRKNVFDWEMGRMIVTIDNLIHLRILHMSCSLRPECMPMKNGLPDVEAAKKIILAVFKEISESHLGTMDMKFMHVSPHGTLHFLGEIASKVPAVN